MHTLCKRMVMSLVVLGSLAYAGPASAQKHYAWEKAPGPIAGQWNVTCSSRGHFVIELKRDGDKQASGYVAELGTAGKYGYTQGEKILRLTADDYGDWVGRLKWRSVSGAERWDPIRLVATQDELNATMTTDDCYKNLPRVEGSSGS
jgi:hypothetical protein